MSLYNIVGSREARPCPKLSLAVSSSTRWGCQSRLCSLGRHLFIGDVPFLRYRRIVPMQCQGLRMRCLHIVYPRNRCVMRRIFDDLWICLSLTKHSNQSVNKLIKIGETLGLWNFYHQSLVYNLRKVCGGSMDAFVQHPLCEVHCPNSG